MHLSCISWYDAIAFANALSQAGLQPAYAINGTEVDWNAEADGWRLPKRLSGNTALGAVPIICMPEATRSVQWLGTPKTAALIPWVKQANGFGIPT